MPSLQFSGRFLPTFVYENGDLVRYERCVPVLSEMIRAAREEGRTAVFFTHHDKRLIYLEDDLSREEAQATGKAFWHRDSYTPGDTGGQEASVLLKAWKDGFNGPSTGGNYRYDASRVTATETKLADKPTRIAVVVNADDTFQRVEHDVDSILRTPTGPQLRKTARETRWP